MNESQYAQLRIITVPVCNLCNKPHYGRLRSIDRCWCDVSGDYRWEEIEEEIIPNPSGQRAE